MHPTGQPAPAPATWSNYKRATHLAGNEEAAERGRGRRGQGRGRGRGLTAVLCQHFWVTPFSACWQLKYAPSLGWDCWDSGTGSAWHLACHTERNGRAAIAIESWPQKLRFIYRSKCYLRHAQCFIIFLFYIVLISNLNTLIFFKRIFA